MRRSRNVAGLGVGTSGPLSAWLGPRETSSLGPNNAGRHTEADGRAVGSLEIRGNLDFFI